MDYKQILSVCEERKHLISMVSVERIVELGYSIGLNENSRVLDFGCGYGTMLKIWSEAFGISGIGIDIESEFIETGKSRLTNDRIELLTEDMFEYKTDEKFDVLLCTEFSCGAVGHDVPFADLKSGLDFLSQFSKLNGKIIFGRLFSKFPNLPKELIDFDGELPTLIEIYEAVKQSGYYITAMATDTTAEWERYITWSAKRDLENLRRTPTDTALASWIDKWYQIYFEYRRQYEGWGLFAVERL